MNGATYVHQIFIKASKEQVWEAITDPAFTKEYFHESLVASVWQQGAPVVYRSAAGEDLIAGTVLEVEPGRRLVMSVRFVYDDELRADGPSRITWEIEEQGETCKLTLRQDFDSENATYRRVQGGWPWILSGLKTYLETGARLPRQRAS